MGGGRRGSGNKEDITDLGLERPGGSPILGSMLGAEAQRARQKRRCAQREGDRKKKWREEEGCTGVREMVVVGVKEAMDSNCC